MEVAPKPEDIGTAISSGSYSYISPEGVVNSTAKVVEEIVVVEELKPEVAP